MTILQRLVPVSALVAAFLLLGCEDVPTADTAGNVGDQVLLGKGGGGKPGGGGPAEITILFDDHSPRPGFYLVGMDRAGAHTAVLSDADEIGFENIAPRWAPDGVHFVYQRNVVAAGTFEIVIGHVDGTITPILSAPSLGGSWDWSPQPLGDGQARIAFVGQEGDLYLMRTDGSEVERLTTGLFVGSLVWSRDATRILAEVRNGVTPISSHLVLFDVACEEGLPCEVTGSTALDLSAFGIAPDDRLGVDDWAHLSDHVLIHYVQVGYYGLRELGILDLTGESPTFNFLTDNPGGQAYNSAWSWDDSEVVYVKFPAGKKPHPGIVIRDVATGVDTKIYDGAAHFGMDWRPTPPTGG